MVRKTTPTRGDREYRKYRYEQAIRIQLSENGLGSSEIERLLRQVGFTKLRHMARHVKPGEADRWIAEAEAKRTLVIQQEYGRRRHRVPEDEQLQDFVLHLTTAVRNRLIRALAKKGREHHEGRWQGGQTGRRPDDESVLALLRDAARSRRGT